MNDRTLSNEKGKIERFEFIYWDVSFFQRDNSEYLVNNVFSLLFLFFYHK